MKIKKFIWILIASIPFVSLTSMPLADAQPTQTSLAIALPSPLTEKEFPLQATLKGENGTPLPNMEIDFYGCVPGCEYLIGAAKTDSNGSASLTCTVLTAETYRFHAMFKGTTNYAPSTSEYVYVVFVFVDYTPYMVGGGLLAVAIIGVVGYIIFRRRKKQLQS